MSKNTDPFLGIDDISIDSIDSEELFNITFDNIEDASPQLQPYLQIGKQLHVSTNYIMFTL